jgi:transglutaminase-like putative cysteine protease
VLFLVLLMAFSRSGLAVPSTLGLALLGVALCPFGRAPHRMSFLDWLLIGPYLLGVGIGFGRDLERSGSVAEAVLMACAAAAAALAPHSRRGGPDAIGFGLCLMLYGVTLLARESVPAQEVALFTGTALLRVAFGRARRVSRTSGGRSRVTWLILAPAVRSALVAVALILAAEAAVSGAADLHRRFEPQFQAMTRQVRALGDRARQLASAVSDWLQEPSTELAPPARPGDSPHGLIEGLISGQHPLEPGPVPGLEIPSIRVLEPDQLRFERDVREPLHWPRMSQRLVLASVKSDQPLPGPPYLRRAVYELYEAGAWSYPDPGWVMWNGRGVAQAPGRVLLWITSQPGPACELFVPSPFLGTLTETPLYRDRAGNVRCALAPPGAVTISAMSHPGGYDLERAVDTRSAGRLVQVPEHLFRNRMFRQALAEVRRRTERGVGLVQAAADYCRETFRYTRTPRHEPEGDPVLEFLRTGRGFCQHYASLTTLLLRAEGVPCRMAAGLAYGAPTEGAWVYGLENGHAWVELWLDAIGWAPLDPTAGAINLDSGAATAPRSGAVPGPRSAAGQASPRGEGGSVGPIEARIPDRSGARPDSRPAATPPPPRPQSGTRPRAPESRTATPTRNETRGDRPPHSSPGSPRRARNGQAASTSGTKPDPSGSDAAEPPERSELAARLERFLAHGDWLLLAAGLVVCIATLGILRRRVRIEEALGDRPRLGHEEARDGLDALRRRLAETRSPREAARLLFELFSRQMAAWGFGRAGHETERDFAMAVGRALGGAAPGAMEAAVGRVEEICYGGLAPSAAQLAELDRWLLGVLRALGRRLGLSLRGLPGRGGWLGRRERIVS